MTSIADALLAAGMVPRTEAVHGERITMLSGADAGKPFTAVITNESDTVFNMDLAEDRRGRRLISFYGTVPSITSHAMLQDSSGRRWKAVRLPGDAYLSTDFELVNVTSGDT